MSAGGSNKLSPKRLIFAAQCPATGRDAKVGRSHDQEPGHVRHRKAGTNARHACRSCTIASTKGRLSGGGPVTQFAMVLLPTSSHLGASRKFPSHVASARSLSPVVSRSVDKSKPACGSCCVGAPSRGICGSRPESNPRQDTDIGCYRRGWILLVARTSLPIALQSVGAQPSASSLQSRSTGTVTHVAPLNPSIVTTHC